MTRWRITAGILALAFAGLPLAALAMEIGGNQSLGVFWTEGSRLGGLAANSLLLLAGVLGIAMPLGVVGALLLFRTDIPGRTAWQYLAVLSLFIPLPLIATAWQMAYNWWSGHQLWLSGLGPAILVHATMATPWVIILSGLGLTWVEPELEEDALLAMPSWRVLLVVSLPRSLPAIGLAAMATALLTLNEIAVTDRFQVRTFAEEVYSQFVGGRSELMVALPQVLLMVALAGFAVIRWRGTLPSRQHLLQQPRSWRLGRWRWPAAIFTVIIALALAGVPLAGLIWKAGLHYGDMAHPGPPVWQWSMLAARLRTTLTDQAALLFQTIWVAMLTGGATALAALVLCWLARGSRAFELTLWISAVVLWALPGPLVGIGLLEAINWLLDLPGGDALSPWLYSRPSPLPHIWVCALRFMPVALAALWPLVRLIPLELEDTAVLDGLTPYQRLRRLVLPLMLAPLAWAALGVGILTLGEISATKLLETPNFKLLAKHVFELMHSSADTDVAAVCLVWLGIVAVGGGAVAFAAARVTVHRLTQIESLR